MSEAAVPSRRRELAPRREKDLAQVLGAFAGLSANRYQLEEILESEVKTRSQDLGTIFTNKYVTDPEFRALFDKVLQERAGEPFEGLRTLSPEREPAR